MFFFSWNGDKEGPCTKTMKVLWIVQYVSYWS